MFEVKNDDSLKDYAMSLAYCKRARIPKRYSYFSFGSRKTGAAMVEQALSHYMNQLGQPHNDLKPQAFRKAASRTNNSSDCEAPYCSTDNYAVHISPDNYDNHNNHNNRNSDDNYNNHNSYDNYNNHNSYDNYNNYHYNNHLYYNQGS
ncbi:unnamed protein product [Nippostrongylus brasiliensis]|uniref:DRBM domain-containing protein n=1 Tax=Nippostrongylus brasiliensis TaxID=27835 RepID=A0A0N4YLV0_NIPBR|nr:unnamed protein product [Nippostrongylus brasiliensis]